MPDLALDLLDVQGDKTYIDGTLGGAGHSKLILSKLSPKGKLISFDKDLEAISRQKNFKAENWTLVKDDFKNIFGYCHKHQIKINGGILLDLGLSSIQLDDLTRGFSFDSEYELDMRLDRSESLSASEVINKYQERTVADILFNYGEETKSRQIAKLIVQSRPFHSCKDLADLIKKYFAKSSQGKTFRIHPATKTFQALRIFVNSELKVLEEFLNLDFDILEPGARIVIIAFHSLEDRIVKNAFRKLDRVKILTRKPLIANDNELQSNPRARSAKLRAIEILC